jgi:hypothetical protein
MERRRLIFGGIMFIIGSLAFAGGYLADRGDGRTPIMVEACSAVASSSLVR